MPDFELDRTGSDRPLLNIPPHGALGGGRVEVFVQLGRAEAGCYICRRPIKVNTTRITFRCYVVESDPTGGESRSKRMKFHVHPGCITKPMGSEVKRHGLDCWDCGAEGADQNKSMHRSTINSWGYCFTTHRFIWGRICDKCQSKERWRHCGNCGIYYPVHMVQPGRLRGDLQDTSGYAAVRHGDPTVPKQQSGLWCTFCMENWEVDTPQKSKEVEEEFEEARRKIMEQGVF